MCLRGCACPFLKNFKNSLRNFLLKLGVLSVAGVDIGPHIISEAISEALPVASVQFIFRNESPQASETRKNVTLPLPSVKGPKIKYVKIFLCAA